MSFTTSDKTYNFAGTAWNEVPAIYGIMNASKQMIYIGETDNLKRRMAEHLADNSHPMHKHGPSYVWAELNRAGEVARRARERQLIVEYAPPANRL